MKLKKLNIHGFKSFQEKTSLLFDKQFSVIVGPNGSGKSNISDAIRWVLGEQSAKSLRGDKMEDVIFSGTENIRPMNFSKVSIEFDNSDHALPLDYDEVVLDRQVYRDGESNFSINKSNCRLKDIRELLLDTGVGKEGYSIISQGRIDEILNSKPEARREIFDEASGVSKYKYNKDESIKKLAKTIENLEKIEGTKEQLEERFSYLEKESEKAKIGIKLYEELEVNQFSLYKKFVEELSKKYEISKNVLIEKQEVKEKTEKEIQELDSKIEPLKKEISQKEENLEKLNSELIKCQEDYNKYNSDFKLLSERLINKKRESESLSFSIKSYSENIEKVGESLLSLSSEFSKLENDIILDSKKEEEISSKLEEINLEIENIKDEISQKSDILKGIKEKHNSLILKQKTALSLSNSFEQEIEKIKSKIESFELLQNDIQIDIESKEGKLALLLGQTNECSDKIAKTRTDIDEKNKFLYKIDKDIYELESKEKSLKSNLAILNNIYENNEGFNKTVQVLMRKSKQVPELSNRLLGTLAELITVDPKYQMAVEYALASNLQNIVTKNQEDAKYIIEYLKNNKLGRLTFLPVDSIASKSTNLTNLSESDYLVVASEAITCDSQIRPVVESLLNKTIIVKDMDMGIRASKKNRFNRVVTLEGDIINASGSMVGGYLNKNTSSGLINRKYNIDKLKNELIVLQENITKSKDDKNTLIAELEFLNKFINEALKELKQHEQEKDKLEDSLKQLKLQNELNKNAMLNAKSDIDEKNKHIDINKYLDGQELEKLEEDIKIIEANLAELDLRKKSLYDSREDKNAEKIQINSLKKMHLRDKDIAVNNKLEYEDRLISLKDNLEKNKMTLKEDQLLINDLSVKIDELDRLSLVSKKTYEDLDRRSLEDKNLLKNLRIVLESETTNRIKLKEEEMQVTLELTKLEDLLAGFDEKIASKRDPLIEEYSLARDEFEEKINNMDPIKTNNSIVRELRTRLREIGSFSVSSIEEFVKVKEELELYNTQITDLINSKEDIEKIIRKLDKEIKTIFEKKFYEINNNFTRIFSVLFEGGSAKLTLDSSDILNSGVDIEVELPGKKLQSLSLMSGGERALTAVALLFAIFETRPAPFCILDEIDAALDDANIGRYINYLKSFKDIQFIIITHRKTSMEIADVLYGVTMEKEGVSKILKLSLEGSK